MSCEKVRYPNRKQARSGMRQFNEVRERDGGVKAKSIYLCPYCRYYHFTTQRRSQSKEDAKYHKEQAEIERYDKQHKSHKWGKKKWKKFKPINFNGIKTEINNAMQKYYSTIKKSNNGKNEIPKTDSNDQTQ